MKFRLGITGGIGSGKSTVCRTFEILGIPVFYSDDVAREIMNTNDVLKTKLNAIVKQDVYNSGLLDRQRLASLIFNDPDLLAEVNSLVHPYVFREFESWVDRQNTDYVILEAAILFEAHAESSVNRILAVTAPVEERIKRVISRNNMTRKQILDRIRNQISEKEMIERSDLIINNAENEMIIPQVIDIHNNIMQLINKSV